MKITRILGAVALTALASDIATQSTDGFAPLEITSVTPSMIGFQPRTLTMTGTGLDRVLHVYVGGEESLILTKEPTTLTFLPREGAPGDWPVRAFTSSEMAESQVMFLPCIVVQPQDVFWNENRTRFQVVDNVFGIHLHAGAPSTFVVWASLDQRSLPLVFPDVAYEFLLGSPYRVLDAGFVPTSVDRVVLQHRLPLALMGETIHFQGIFNMDLGPIDRRSFSNMVSIELY